MITITQGDSLGQDIFCEDFTDLEVFDENWEGVWGIVTSIGQPPILTGTHTFSADRKWMYMRITPEQTNTLLKGKYFLVTRVSNPAIQFSEQIQKEGLTVEQRGI